MVSQMHLIVFLLFCYFVIMCYNMKMDRDYICHCSVLWHQMLRWQVGSKIFNREKLLWKEVWRKKYRTEGKFKLWSGCNMALANPTGNCEVSIACPSVLLRAEVDGSLCPHCLATIVGCCLYKAALCSQGWQWMSEQLRLVLPVPHTWQ